MKKLHKYLTATLIIISTTLLLGCEKEKNINEKDLPSQATLFLNTHFSGSAISSTVKDIEGNNTTFEVILANGINIDFDKNGNCISMDGHGKRLPDSAIPSAILLYVQTYYPDNFITDWGFEPFGQKVELSNEIELGFELDGTFIKIIR